MIINRPNIPVKTRSPKIDAEELFWGCMLAFMLLLIAIALLGHLLS